MAMQRLRRALGGAWRRRPSRRVLRDFEAGGIAIAAFVGVTSFWYKDIYVPSRLPAALVVTPELEEVARWNDTALVRLRLSLINHSPSRVYVPALWYRASGISVRPRRPDDDEFVRSPNDDMPLSYARFSAVQKEEVIASRRVFEGRKTWFQPGGESRFEEYIAVPVCEYRMLRVNVDYFYTKDVEQLARIEWSYRDGAISPAFLMQGRGGRLEALSNSKPAHVRWKTRNGAGSNWSYAILPLRGAAPGSGADGCGRGA